MPTSATRPDPGGRTGRPRSARRRAPALALAVQYAVARPGLPAAASLRRWAAVALERDVAATLRFVGLAEGRTLNAIYRGKDHGTNVLTFVYDDAVPLAGDIVLCVPVLRREARAGGVTLRAHCAHLVVHGMLHLQGHDHATPREAARMEARETALLETLGIADPYAPRDAGERRRAGGR
jgi:probable rRNA maturation factor